MPLDCVLDESDILVLGAPHKAYRELARRRPRRRRRLGRPGRRHPSVNSGDAAHAGTALEHRSADRLRDRLRAVDPRDLPRLSRCRLARGHLHRRRRDVAGRWQPVVGRPSGGDVRRPSPDVVALRPIHRAADRPEPHRVGHWRVGHGPVDDPTTGASRLLARLSAIRASDPPWPPGAARPRA